MKAKNVSKQIINDLKIYYKLKSNADLAKLLGISPQVISNWISRNSIDYDIIIKRCPDIDANWLLTGEGEMLKKNEQQVGDISNSTFLGANVVGDHITFTNNGGKDKVIEKQEEQVKHSYGVLIDELHRFHEIAIKREAYIEQQDKYIDRIVKESYHRNERNMERLDQLIRLVIEQNQKIQERADRLLTLLENKS